MKKQIFSILLAVAMLLSCLAGCGTAPNQTTSPPTTTGQPVIVPEPTVESTPEPTAAPMAEPLPKPTPKPTPESKVCNLTVTGADVPMTQFAQEEILAAGRDHGVEAAWTVAFNGVDDSLDVQAYRITVSENTISIQGGDEAGLMYGGLEVAEQIALYGAEGVQEASASPFALNRGYILNCPLDMRTPSYASPGKAGQDNIASMWDIEFWHAFFDGMARNRCNLFFMKIINPYPSMVRVPGYEDCALEDVWRTTLEYDDSARGDCTNLVPPERWEPGNYEIVKKITMDEKIAFWREVMAYAKSRGVKFYIRHGNIYPFVESRYYDITDEKENPVTTDYFHKACRALVETYPDLAGVGISTGENMGWSNDIEDKKANVYWVHDVYGLAINEALEQTPEREFLMVADAGGALMADVNVSEIVHTATYSSTHMYACATPHLVDKKINSTEDRYVFMCRNEDVFNMRWGDPDFLRAFVKNMPGQDKLWGYMTGSDGYCLGRDYSNLDPDLTGQLYTEKHWFNYFLMFRFLFEPDLSDQRIADVFTHYYMDEPGGDLLLKATSTAGKIIPMVNKTFYMSNGDYTWFAEGCWSHPSTSGYISLDTWMKGDNTYVDGSAMSIEEYAVSLAKGEELNVAGRILPTEVADNLRAYAEEVLALCGEIRAANPKGDSLSYVQKEYWQQLEDNEAMAHLGLFYAEKILSAIDLRLFNDTQDESYRNSAAAHMEQAAESFGTYAAIISANYMPQRLSRVGYFDVNFILEEVKGDVELIRTWEPRTIRPSYRPPAKTDFFSGNEN